MPNETNEPTNEQTNDGLSGHERELAELRKQSASLSAAQENRFIHINALCDAIHRANRNSGWWNVPHDSPATSILVNPYIVVTKIALIHSEISEALEAYRTDSQDKHLSWRTGIAVELADAAIRILDLAGALCIPLGTVMEEKMKFNAAREDHKPEVRAQPGGKRF